MPDAPAAPPPVPIVPGELSDPRGAGRFAPSPSNDLHLGNLRTALLAHAFARRSGRRFLLRIEDVDTGRSRPEVARRQIEDLAAIGLEWDQPLWYQSERFPVYARVLAQLQARGLVYECYCSRKDILSAPRAPHTPPGAYPGTCRELTAAERAAARERLRADGREPALRLRVPAGLERSVQDELHGIYTGRVDDFVLRRGDGAWAYNFAVVIDDIAAGVNQVVRGEDLLESAPRQAYLTELLGGSVPEYIHVPLLLSPTGERLSKRDGAVTLRERLANGESPQQVRAEILDSLTPELRALFA